MNGVKSEQTIKHEQHRQNRWLHDLRHFYASRAALNPTPLLSRHLLLLPRVPQQREEAAQNAGAADRRQDAGDRRERQHEADHDA